MSTNTTLMETDMSEKIEAIAKVCHQANKAFCAYLGDTSQKDWDDSPEWHRASLKNGVKFHMENNDASDSSSHDNWMAEKVADGWIWGVTKDADAKTHPCIVPFNELPKEQQFKDALFRAIVLSFIS